MEQLDWQREAWKHVTISYSVRGTRRKLTQPTQYLGNKYALYNSTVPIYK